MWRILFIKSRKYYDITIFIPYFVTMKLTNRRTWSYPDVMVVWPMLSTGGDNHCTYTSNMYPVGVHALGLPLSNAQAWSNMLSSRSLIRLFQFMQLKDENLPITWSVNWPRHRDLKRQYSRNTPRGDFCSLEGFSGMVWNVSFRLCKKSLIRLFARSGTQ